MLNLSGGVTTHGGRRQHAAGAGVRLRIRRARRATSPSGSTRTSARIREEAEATSSVAKLVYIDTYLSNKFVFLRFNYTTGDAAGQNMVGRATFAACSWILENAANIRHFYLESNFATDKKASQINIMRTRGKRVTAEATIPRDVLLQHMRVDPETLHYHAGISNVGAFLSGANNNGCHSPNGITAMFIATGQDVANVAESSAGVVYTEVTPDSKDLYISITIPSLIVATHGGGTGLPPSANAWRSSAASAGARSRSSPRSSPAWCSRARSRSPPRSPRSTGCRATSSTGGTGRAWMPPDRTAAPATGAPPPAPGPASAPRPRLWRSRSHRRAKRLPINCLRRLPRPRHRSPSSRSRCPPLRRRRPASS